jgi:hypothetical protein
VYNTLCWQNGVVGVVKTDSSVANNETENPEHFRIFVTVFT